MTLTQYVSVDTITAWTRTSTSEEWNYIPRCGVQEAYDSAPEDLRIALGMRTYRDVYHLLTHTNDDRFHYRIQLHNISR